MERCDSLWKQVSSLLIAFTVASLRRLSSSPRSALSFASGAASPTSILWYHGERGSFLLLLLLFCHYPQLFGLLPPDLTNNIWRYQNAGLLPQLQVFLSLPFITKSTKSFPPSYLFPSKVGSFSRQYNWARVPCLLSSPPLHSFKTLWPSMVLTMLLLCLSIHSATVQSPVAPNGFVKRPHHRAWHSVFGAIAALDAISLL